MVHKDKKSLYFIACLLEPNWHQHVRGLQHEMCKKFNACKSLGSPPHITLIPPAWIPISLESKIINLSRKYYTSEMEVIADNISHFGDRVIFIDIKRSQKLNVLKNQLDEALDHVNIPFKRNTNFHPHITIGHRILTSVFEKAWKYFGAQKMEGPIKLRTPIVLRHNQKNWEIIT